MRIAVFDNLPEGGAKRVVFEQLKRLAKRHTILYVTNDVVSAFDASSLPITLVRLPLALSTHHGLLRPLQEMSLFTSFLSLYGEAAETIRKWRPQVVLVHPCRETQAPFLLSLLNTVPTVYFGEEWLRVVYEPDLHPLTALSLSTAWYEWLRRRMWQWVDQVNVSRAATIAVNSDYTAGCFLKAYKRTTLVLPLGVNNVFFSPDRKMGKRPYFLFVGEKEMINGYPLLVDALAQTDLPFQVRCITFKESSFRLSETEMREMYRNAVATLCLSVREPFGLVALESMACGTPVIAVSEGGYTETVVDEQTGLLVERTPHDLVRAMQRLSTDTALLTRLQQGARKHVVAHFSWQRHVRELERILKEVAHD